MKRSERLNIIVELNAGNEKKALQAFADVQRRKQEAEAQLASLKSYLLDYKIQQQSLSETGVNIKQVLEFRAFYSKLEQAIEEQTLLVFNVKKQVDKVRMHWEKQHQKTSSVCSSIACSNLL